MIVLRLVAAVLAVALAYPSAATANGDPASDVLPAQDVFFPYAPPTSNGVARAVLQLAGRMRAAGWPVKVAIIATPRDLGAVGEFFGRPQAYADFLGSEFGAPRLLVVMPRGFGGQRLGDDPGRAFEGLSPATEGGDALAMLALTAMARLAALNEHPVTFPKIDRSARGRRPYREQAVTHSGSTAGGDGSSDAQGRSPLPFIGPLVLVALALATLRLVDRRRETDRV